MTFERGFLQYWRLHERGFALCFIDLYEEDFAKIDATGLAADIYDGIPSSLCGNASRYILSSAGNDIRAQQVRTLIPDILSSYTVNSDTSNHLYEIDFLISKGDKIAPIEVKSGQYRNHKSLDIFSTKFSSRICDKYVVHTKDYK